jgi:hypothetical protein
MRLSTQALAVAAAFLTCGFVQQQMPPGFAGHMEAPEALWDVLASAKVEADSAKGIYRAIFSDAVKGYDGASIKISGFYMPIEASTKPRHFALSRRNLGCPFCPPSEPTEVVEVMATDGIAPQADLITVEGRLRLVAESSQGLFYRIEGAVAK